MGRGVRVQYLIDRDLIWEGRTRSEEPAVNERRLVTQMLLTLPEINERILRMRFGCNLERPMGAGEIATRLGLSAHEVRYMLRSSIRQLKIEFLALEVWLYIAARIARNTTISH